MLTNLISFLQNQQSTHFAARGQEGIFNKLASKIMIKGMSRSWIHHSWTSDEEREENESFYDIGGEG